MIYLIDISNHSFSLQEEDLSIPALVFPKSYIAYSVHVKSIQEAEDQPLICIIHNQKGVAIVKYKRFDEISIDGVVYENSKLCVQALNEMIYSGIIIDSSGITTDSEDGILSFITTDSEDGPIQRILIDMEDL